MRIASLMFAQELMFLFEDRGAPIQSIMGSQIQKCARHTLGQALTNQQLTGLVLLLAEIGVTHDNRFMFRVGCFTADMLTAGEPPQF